MPAELCKSKDTELWLPRSKCLIVTLPQGYLPVASVDSRKLTYLKKERTLGYAVYFCGQTNESVYEGEYRNSIKDMVTFLG